MFLRILFSLLILAEIAGCAAGLDPSRVSALGQSRIEVVSPAPNAEIDASAVEISFRFHKGRKDGGEHLHLYLDGEKWGIVKTSPVRLGRLTPGPHTVAFEIVTIDHAPVGEKTTVHFRVRQSVP